MNDHTPDAASLSPFFREPVVPAVQLPAPAPVEGVLAKKLIPVPGTEEYAEALQAAVNRHPAGTALQEREPAPEVTPGPSPVLEGTFAIFVTPEESIVVAYRPRGADEDKHFVVPAFLVAMATQQTGHTVHDIVAGLKEGM